MFHGRACVRENAHYYVAPDVPVHVRKHIILTITTTDVAESMQAHFAEHSENNNFTVINTSADIQTCEHITHSGLIS